MGLWREDTARLVGARDVTGSCSSLCSFRVFLHREVILLHISLLGFALFIGRNDYVGGLAFLASWCGGEWLLDGTDR